MRGRPCSSDTARPEHARPARAWENGLHMDRREGPGFGAMIGLVALVVATVILVFFGVGYALGRIFL